MNYFEHYIKEEIATCFVLLFVFIGRILIAKMVRRYAKTHVEIEHRTNLVIKYINLMINIIATLSLIIIWGVQKKDIFITLSSLTTVVGVAMFAQWSILSNITSGIILFFFLPFKIGDVIKIHDKDFPIQGKIEDISAFHISLLTTDNEKVTYPNNLLLQKGISIITSTFEEKDFTD
jgi:small-conductance mechanosensitive channel